MSFDKCIQNARAEGVIDDAEQKRIQDLYQGHIEQNAARMPPIEAEQAAARATFNQLDFEAKLRKRRKLLQAETYRRVEQDLRTYRNNQGEEDIAQAATNLIEGDVLSKTTSVETRKQAIRGLALSKMNDVLATFRRNMLGSVRNKAKLRNVIREAFGEDTGDIHARELATSWSETAEYLRKRFNAAGGAISKMANWGFPQYHNMLAIRKAGYDQWRSEILPKLDLDNMIDETTGLPFNEQSIEIALNDVYQTLISNGANKLKPSGAPSGKSLANQKRDHRFLKFKNADAWFEYQQKFGNENVFDTMITHIDTMSRDIAFMETLGPNPSATLQYVRGVLRKEAGMNPDKADRINRKLALMETLYSAASDKMNVPVDGRIAQTFGGLRQVLVSAQLGAASLAAITDFNFVRIAKRMTGLPQTDTIRRYLNLISPLSAAEKGKIAVSQGLIATGWTSVAAAQMRFVGDISGPEITRRISDFVMRASLLSPHTQANQWAFGMSFTNYVSQNRSKPWAALPDDLKKTFENYGFNEDRWDIIRSTRPMEYEGETFLTAPDIESRTDIQQKLAFDLSTRYLEMINAETNFAVPTASLRGRVLLTGDSRPGTLGGELGRSFAMYKNFGVTLVNTHLARGMSQPGLAGKGRYMADLIITTTMMGALAMQLKEMAKGRDPRPMDSPEFWGAAFLQGGGLGIYGDFLFSDTSRYGSGLEATIAGPVVGLANDIKDLTVGNIQQAARGEDTKIASETISFAARYTPGSSIFYIRAALERLVVDRLDMLANPNSIKDMQQLERKYMREYGQQYWWRPGQMTPDRAPDIGAAAGDLAQ
jgi:hypothetical protein